MSVRRDGSTALGGECEICGSREWTRVGSYVIEVEGNPLSGTRRYLRRCDGCGVVYVDPRPMQQVFGGFAADEQRDMGNKETWIRRLKTLERIHSAGRVLDVGSGAGAFLSYARTRGWSPLGLDVQEEFARSTSQRLNVNVHVGEMTDPEIQAQQFDAVCMWDVIEHVLSIRGMLTAAAKIVKPGGVLAVSTINAGSVNAQLFRGRWVFWNRPGTVPEHMQGFTRYALSQAVRNAGFRPVYTHTYFAAGAIIEPLTRLVVSKRRLGPAWVKARESSAGRGGAFVLWRGVEVLGRPLDLVQRGDILEMYAVRTTDGACS
jgi:2-polyprenyl-3-methyl-5-hydroxy-6-metoxy-1,4-benzoquinol methylase